MSTPSQLPQSNSKIHQSVCNNMECTFVTTRARSQQTHQQTVYTQPILTLTPSQLIQSITKSQLPPRQTLPMTPQSTPPPAPIVPTLTSTPSQRLKSNSKTSTVSQQLDNTNTRHYRILGSVVTLINRLYTTNIYVNPQSTPVVQYKKSTLFTTNISHFPIASIGPTASFTLGQLPKPKTKSRHPVVKPSRLSQLKPMTSQHI